MTPQLDHQNLKLLLQISHFLVLIDSQFSVSLNKWLNLRLGEQTEVHLKPKVYAGDLEENFFSVLEVIADYACLGEICHSLAPFTDIVGTQTV